MNPRQLEHFKLFDDLLLLPQISTSDKNSKVFSETVEAVRTIMKGNNSCSQFYGGAGEDALDEIAKRATFKPFQGNSSTGIRMSIPTLVARGTVPIFLGNEYFAVSPSVVEVNTNGSFIKKIAVGNARLPRFGNYNAGSLKSRVLQLLHEMGHITIVKTYPTIRIYKQKNGKSSVVNFILLVHLLTLDGINLKEGIDESKSSSLSEDNTEKILTACKTQIDAIQNGD